MTSDTAARYLEDGYLHIRHLFTGAQIETARRAVEHLPEWIRQQSGHPNIQRVQPLQTCAALADRSWIAGFYDTPALEELLDTLFRGRMAPTPNMARDPHVTGLLISPTDRWWSTGLHRDYRDLVANLDIRAWQSRTADIRYFNQINIPLLPDRSLWIVPGSHRRDDLEKERRLVEARARYSSCQNRFSDPRENDIRRCELMDALRECGADNLDADAGDFILYRSNMLHCGVYEPCAKRLTLHDAVYSKQWHDYALSVMSASAGKRGA